MENYKIFTICFFPLNTDIISGVLWNLPIEGLTEEDSCIKVYSKVSAKLKKSQIESELNNLIKNNLLEKFSIDEGEVEIRNWNEEWEKKLSVIHVGKKIIIKPSAIDYKPKPDEILIKLDPKMSFGTGEHATTKLCLEILENEINSFDIVLDIGSGTGILSIASAKLGAKQIIAVDNDEWCFINGKENVELNNVSNKVDLLKGTLNEIEQADFDIIVANINVNILTNFAEDIASKIKKAGKLILSGFYTHNSSELTKVYENYGFTLVSQYSKDEWAAILLVKN